MTQHPPTSTLFPYTTLFRSRGRGEAGARRSLETRAPNRDDEGRLKRLGDLHHLGSALLRSEEHTSELQSRGHLVCRLLLEKKKPPRPSQESQTRTSNRPTDH